MATNGTEEVKEAGKTINEQIAELEKRIRIVEKNMFHQASDIPQPKKSPLLQGQLSANKKKGQSEK
jgi:hypothetical protein